MTHKRKKSLVVAENVRKMWQKKQVERLGLNVFDP